VPGISYSGCGIEPKIEIIECGGDITQCNYPKCAKAQAEAIVITNLLEEKVREIKDRFEDI